MNYDACRFAFDCLNSSLWWRDIMLWTAIGGIAVVIVIWLVRRS